jgi:hypothetical protein
LGHVQRGGSPSAFDRILVRLYTSWVAAHTTFPVCFLAFWEGPQRKES